MHPTLFLLPALVIGSLAYAAVDDVWGAIRSGTPIVTPRGLAEMAVTALFCVGFVICVAPPISWLMEVVL